MTIDGISDHEAVLVKSDTIVHLIDPPAQSVYLWSQTNFDYIRHTIQGYYDKFVAHLYKFQKNIGVHGLHLV